MSVLRQLVAAWDRPRRQVDTAAPASVDSTGDDALMSEAPIDQPAWPPAAPPAPSAPPAPAAPRRPGSVTASGVLLIVLGLLIALFGVMAAIVGAALPALRSSPDFIDQVGTLPESFGTFVLLLGAILLAWGVAEVLAGAFVLQRRTWARIAGIVVGILGALAGLAGSLPGQDGVNVLGLAISLLWVAAHVYAILVLIRVGAWFSAEGAAHI
jgi:hypothetical protein